MDLSSTIVPKSDQLNAEDMLAGSLTVTVESVTPGKAEQPVDVHLVEYPGRAYRPSKTMRRVMVKVWGKESDTYTGHRMTLYRDPDVKFGGQKIGGIKISHMDGIDKPVSMALTETKGKRAVHTVNPLRDTPVPTRPTGPAPITDAQVTALMRALTSAGLDDRDEALTKLREVTGRDVRGPRDLTTDEAASIIDKLTADVRMAGGAA